MSEQLQFIDNEPDRKIGADNDDFHKGDSSIPTSEDQDSITGGREASVIQILRNAIYLARPVFRPDRRAAIKDLMLLGLGSFALIERFMKVEDTERVHAITPDHPASAEPRPVKPAGFEVYAVATGWRLELPLENYRIDSLPASRLPNAVRAYRHGVHGGFDLYIPYGSPVRSVADGIVTRADSDFCEVRPDHYRHLLATCSALSLTPPDVLRRLMGRTVEIDHGLRQGIRLRSVYAHLSAVNVNEGESVRQGDLIAEVGNSGTSSGVRGTHEDAHLHFDLRFQRAEGKESFFGEGLSESEIRKYLTEVFGNG